ncbi:hypothetical protein HIM_09788 [Hirsutella minnesotensis 3608]|uniref:Uncharacterized protein n=1 Tax=Hirsutella minnesotensis 3608 TaxID=1043627 RepID=A0A0F8A2X3_9HYPO|nr:hypothetical protein HIM_09788 [Hirsutella minnesotensis 3608]
MDRLRPSRPAKDRRAGNESMSAIEAEQSQSRFAGITNMFGRKNRGVNSTSPDPESAPIVDSTDGRSGSRARSASTPSRQQRRQNQPRREPAMPMSDVPPRPIAGEGDVESGGGQHPRRFFLCLPWVESQRMRTQIKTSILSAVFALLLLGFFLAVTLTKTLKQNEISVLIVLAILAAAALFVFSIVRLLLIKLRPEREQRRGAPVPATLRPNNYAVPSKPIPVLLARDEEAAGIQSETVTSRPPAYGIWRESVRVDPNRLFWKRNDSPAVPPLRNVSRPPSYASDDGVQYVMEARPRPIPTPGRSTYDAEVVEPMRPTAPRYL